MEERETKKKRKYEKRSSWWIYFEETVKGEVAECKQKDCDHKTIKFMGSTSSLKRHMKHITKILQKKMENSKIM